MARLVILLPATAIDQHRNIEWAWATTKGNGWRLCLVYVILPVLMNLIRISVFNLLKDYPVLVFAFVFFSLYVIYSIEIALISISFKYLAADNS